MGTGRVIGEIEIDMAPLIGKTEGRQKICISKCELSNCYMEIEFKVHETQEN